MYDFFYLFIYFSTYWIQLTVPEDLVRWSGWDPLLLETDWIPKQKWQAYAEVFTVVSISHQVSWHEAQRKNRVQLEWPLPRSLLSVQLLYLKVQVLAYHLHAGEGAC